MAVNQRARDKGRQLRARLIGGGTTSEVATPVSPPPQPNNTTAPSANTGYFTSDPVSYIATQGVGFNQALPGLFQPGNFPEVPTYQELLNGGINSYNSATSGMYNNALNSMNATLNPNTIGGYFKPVQALSPGELLGGYQNIAQLTPEQLLQGYGPNLARENMDTYRDDYSAQLLRNMKYANQNAITQAQEMAGSRGMMGGMQNAALAANMQNAMRGYTQGMSELEANLAQLAVAQREQDISKQISSGSTLAQALTSQRGQDINQSISRGSTLAEALMAQRGQDVGFNTAYGQALTNAAVAKAQAQAGLAGMQLGTYGDIAKSAIGAAPALSAMQQQAYTAPYQLAKDYSQFVQQQNTAAQQQMMTQQLMDYANSINSSYQNLYGVNNETTNNAFNNISGLLNTYINGEYSVQAAEASKPDPFTSMFSFGL